MFGLTFSLVHEIFQFAFKMIIFFLNSPYWSSSNLSMGSYWPAWLLLGFPLVSYGYLYICPLYIQQGFNGDLFLFSLWWRRCPRVQTDTTVQQSRHGQLDIIQLSNFQCTSSTLKDNSMHQLSFKGQRSAMYLH